jgi:MYXO-CTERM domain-containing protein
VHWFSDSGQAGPPDDNIEAKIQVVEAQYHGELSKQSYPTLQDAPIAMTVGQSMDGWIELTNVGTATWKAGETKLAPTPRDKNSPLAGSAWLSPTRVSTLAADVAPGGTGHFPLQLTASAVGDYTQTFSLVEEGVTWFADAPKGGGPPDDLLAVHVVVTDGKPDGGAGGSGGSGGHGSSHDGGVDGGGGEEDTKGGCSCRVGVGESDRPAAAWLAVAAALVLARRKRR